MSSGLEDEGVEFRPWWSLAPGVTYLNHGSFGPAPKPVLAARQRWFEELESNPVDFYTRRLDGLLTEVRRRLGELLHCDGDDLLLVDNATWAMNVVAQSVRLRPGDEVLFTDHEYGAVLRIWQQRAEEAGARLVVQPLPEPFTSANEVVERLFAAATPRTRLLVFSHITSPTAVILPAEAICRRARELNIPVCVDGPHAPLQVPVDLTALDCDFYAASCHKWLCAPLGAGFLYVNRRVRDKIRPVIVSWGTRYPPRETASLHDEFTWLGTRDPSAHLAVPAAIDFFERIGAERFRRYTHALAQYARQQISQLTGLEPLVPDSADWYGSMIALPLPAGDGPALQAALWQRFRIEVPLMQWNDRRWIRPSSHLYTTRDDIDRCVAALRELRDRQQW